PQCLLVYAAVVLQPRYHFHVNVERAEWRYRRNPQQTYAEIFDRRRGCPIKPSPDRPRFPQQAFPRPLQSCPEQDPLADCQWLTIQRGHAFGWSTPGLQY